MTNKRVGRSLFPGFRSPNYTQVPDELFDELLPVLSGAELKVLLYIIRRTFGFKRDRDSISLSQMRTGIRKRDGSVLDRGAGVSKPTLLQALRSLAERGIIATERRRSAERGDQPTVYALRVAAEGADRQKPIHPLVKNLDHGGGQASLPPAWSRNMATQERDGHQTDLDPSNFERSHDRMDASQRGAHPDVPAAAEAPRSGNRPLGRGAGVPVPLGEVLMLRASQAAGAARRRRRAAGNAGHSEARERLRAFFQDASVELGDEAPLASTITRALHVFTAAGVPQERWGDALFQARGRTLENGARIRKRASGRFGSHRTNQIPYFFACLNRIVGLRPGPVDRAPSHS